MVLDISGGALQAGSRTDRPAMINAANEQNRARQERPETGQTSANNAAVITNISAAALEITRPVNPTEQTADQDRIRDVIEQEVRGQSQVREQEQDRTSFREASKVDIVV